MVKVLSFNPVDGVLDEVVVVAGTQYYGIELIGPKNGTNVTFTTPDKFLPDTIEVYRNGDRQDDGDYSLSESGGPGTGYNTVTFGPEHPPLSWEKLFVDYTV